MMKQIPAFAVALCVLFLIGATSSAHAQRAPGRMGVGAATRNDIGISAFREGNFIVRQTDYTTGPGGAVGMGNRAHWYDSTIVWQDSVAVNRASDLANQNVLNMGVGEATAENFPGGGTAVGVNQPTFYGPQLVAGNIGGSSGSEGPISPAQMAQLMSALARADSADSMLSMDGFTTAEVAQIYANYIIVPGQNGSGVHIVPSTEINTPSSVMTSLDLYPPMLCGH